MSRIIAKAVAALALAATSAACAPTLAQRGYVPEKTDFSADLQTGVDTKATVTAKLGTPSTTGAFDEGVWYYVTEIEATRAFFDPKDTDRSVVVVRFNPDDTVSAVERFGLEKGRVVRLSDDVTPTRGRELGILEQLFGNVGRTPTQIGAEDQSRENRR